MTRTWLASVIAVAAGQAAGCIIATGQHDTVDDSDALLDVAWSLRDVDGVVSACPANGTLAAVLSQPVDPLGHALGAPQTDLFDCAAQGGTIRLIPDEYVVSVRIESAAGGSVYADSLASDLIDLTAFDSAASFDIYNDGGYLALAWVLTGATGAPPASLSCGDAGASTIEPVVQAAATGALVDTIPLPCTNGLGISSVIPEGDYLVSLGAATSQRTVGMSAARPVHVAGQNRVTDLEPITIPIAGK